MIKYKIKLVLRYIIELIKINKKILLILKDKQYITVELQLYTNIIEVFKAL